MFRVPTFSEKKKVLPESIEKYSDYHMKKYVDFAIGTPACSKILKLL